ncbi:iron-containing alcohol dehydrogenase [Paenibacillus naphthalenovorans]|uniref:iron-containing alcohol dehydrogenase n=1 Tax=Paenibacillus naphthalenovorans TaxID=162209 RepID=UPI000891F868|nr:iron-containing alcohol dehydrogenase [Paenibacillus naphthalenovorans]SDJ78627.1 alcohol dehydrogenase [Paenibacillus naphthalenovorans]
MPFTYFLPTTVKCGAGISLTVGEILRRDFEADGVFIVTDRGIRDAGLLEPILASLREQRVAYGLFDETEPNPSADSIMNGMAKLQASGMRHVLAVGGGSSIDTAKGIAIMATNPGHILDYEGVGRIPNDGYPVIAIPTTAGTGSEVTASTIVTNAQTQFKAAVISPRLFPKLALLDAELTRKLPPFITAATGMDALTHAIESYTSKGATPVSRAFALQAIAMIGRHLKPAYFVGDDMASRESMLVASMMAGAAFAQSRLGNVHAISHTLGGIFNIAHGVANAALLPYVMRFNLPTCPDKMRDIAAALGADTTGMSAEEGAARAIELVVGLNEALGIPKTIKELGVTLDKLPKMVDDAMKSGNVLINPRLTTPHDIRSIIENAFHGVL